MEENAEAVEHGPHVQAVRDEANGDDSPAVEDSRPARAPLVEGRRGQLPRPVDSIGGLWDQLRLMSLANYPVLVGFGQITQKSDDPSRSLEPIALSAEAARRAERDSGRQILRHVD